MSAAYAVIPARVPQLRQCGLCAKYRVLVPVYEVCETCLPETLASLREHAAMARDAAIDDAIRYEAQENCRWCQKRREYRRIEPGEMSVPRIGTAIYAPPRRCNHQRRA